MPLWSITSTVLIAACGAILTGCASGRSDASASRGNATVRSLTYYAAWVDARASALAAKPSATKTSAVAGSPSSKPSAATARRPVPPASVPAAASEPQPRYEYTVELDGGGYRRLVGQRDLGIRVNDRVLVQGDEVTRAQ